MIAIFKILFCLSSTAVQWKLPFNICFSFGILKIKVRKIQLLSKISISKNILLLLFSQLTVILLILYMLVNLVCLIKNLTKIFPVEIKDGSHKNFI